MNSRAERFSLRCLRLLTFMVVLSIAACVAVANLSSEPLTDEDVGKVLQGTSIERTCGWPITWYWRSPLVPFARATNPAAIQWTLSRYSAAPLAANIVVWLAMLAGVLFSSEWLIRRYPNRLRWRPRTATVLALLLATAIIVLANLSSDTGFGQSQSHSCGWPLIWYWQSYTGIWMQEFSEWHFSAVALAGNIVIWAALLAVIAMTCDRLAPRYRLRLRWSLRVMLAGVALVAVVCAWFADALKRAKDEDAMVALLKPDDGFVYLKGRGPAWLDFFGAGRVRRRLVGVYISDVPRQVSEVELFKKLAGFPHLRYLDVQPNLSPEAESVLAEMRQLRTLGIHGRMYHREDQLATLSAVAKLTDLEHLNVSVSVAGAGDLDPLARLTNLKSLALEIRNNVRARDGLAAIAKLTQLEQLSLTTRQSTSVDLACLAGLTNLKSLVIQCTPGGAAPLPALPQLEALGLSYVPVADADVARLAASGRLRTLCLGHSGISEAGLAGLALVPSLTELALDEDTLTVEGLEALAALKSLKSLHVTHLREASTDYDDLDELVLDDGESLEIRSSGLERLREVIDSLRRANPGIVIDTDFEGCEEREFQEMIDLEPPAGSEAAL